MRASALRQLCHFEQPRYGSRSSSSPSPFYSGGRGMSSSSSRFNYPMHGGAGMGGERASCNGGSGSTWVANHSANASSLTTRPTSFFAPQRENPQQLHQQLQQQHQGNLRDRAENLFPQPVGYEREIFMKNRGEISNDSA